MVGRIMAFGDLRPADVTAWRDLAARAAEPNPFAEPEVVLPAFRALQRPSDAALLVVTDQGRWTACLPVRRVTRWRRLPLPAIATWRHPYCFLGTPLVDSAAPAAALDGLLDVASRSAGVLALDWLGVDGPVAAGLDRALATRGLRPATWERFERAVLRQGDAIGMTGRHGKELRRLRRVLEREAGGPVRTADLSTDPRAVGDFLVLEARGWKGRSGTSLMAAGHARFFTEMCAAFADAGRLHLLSLEAAGTPVAMKCTLLAGDAAFCFKITYDERWARQSPGIQLEVDMADEFGRRADLAWMDSCAEPDNAMINRLWPDRRTLTTLLVPVRRRWSWLPPAVLQLRSAMDGRLASQRKATDDWAT